MIIGREVLNKDAFNNKGLVIKGKVVEILNDMMGTHCLVKWDQGMPGESWFPLTSLKLL